MKKVSWFIMKRLLSMLCIILVVAMSVPFAQPVTAATIVDENYVKNKINSLRTIFPGGSSYFTIDGDACNKNDSGAKIYSDGVASWCDSTSCQSCELANILENNTNAKKAISQVPALESLKSNTSNSCCAFANFAFCYIFEHVYTTNSTVISTTNAGITDQFLSALKCGDLIKCYKNFETDTASHWAIYLSHDSKYVYFYESNNLSPCRVEYDNKRPRNGLKMKNDGSWVKLVAFRSNTHTSRLTVKDNYKVTANDGFLSIRKNHTTSSTKLGEIPTGTTFTVTKYDNNGNWGYVTYNGVSGWCRLYDVELTSSSSSNNDSNSNNTGSTTIPADDYYLLTAPDGFQVLRSSYSTSSTKILDIPTPSIVCVTKYSPDGKWGYVCYDGKMGWINLYYVEKHYHYYGGSRVIKEPTCTETGANEEYCACGLTQTVTTPALEHNYSSVFSVDKNAGCTTEGSKSRHCTRCSAVTEVTVIPAKGHSYGEWTITQAATCFAKGSKQRVCGCKTIEKAEIAALGHNYSSSWTTDKIATCTKEGSKSHHCTRCSAATDVTVIQATGHNFGAWQTEKKAEVGQSGLSARVCSTCSTRETKIIPPLSDDGHTHQFGEWTIVKKATCFETGNAVRKCNACEAKETQDLAIVPHVFGEWKMVKKPTLFTEGEMQKQCENCDMLEKQIVPVLVDDSEIVVEVVPNVDDKPSVEDVTDADKQEQTDITDLPAVDEKVEDTTPTDETISDDDNDQKGLSWTTVILILGLAAICGGTAIVLVYKLKK